jgi:hypothetical protein
MSLVNNFYNKNQEFKNGIYNTISGFLLEQELILINIINNNQYSMLLKKRQYYQ